MHAVTKRVAKEMLEVDAFCKITKSITEATKKQNVYKLFDVLQGTVTVNSIQHTNMHLTETRRSYQLQNGKGKNWVQWWIRPNHLRLLCKPFSEMSSSDWDNGPHNTTGVKWINSLTKNCNKKCFIIKQCSIMKRI